MPIFKIVRTDTFTAYIEAPTADMAITETKGWSHSDWGPNFGETDTVSMGMMPDSTRPDYTLNLQGSPHEHDFDDEYTGGCVYCDATQLGSATPKEGPTDQ